MARLNLGLIVKCRLSDISSTIHEARPGVAIPGVAIPPNGFSVSTGKVNSYCLDEWPP
jgi:hypothetical protein